MTSSSQICEEILVILVAPLSEEILVVLVAPLGCKLDFFNTWKAAVVIGIALAEISRIL